MKSSHYTLTGCSAKIERAKFTKRNLETGEVEGEEDGFVLIIQDPHEPAVYQLPFDESTKDQLIEQMTGGIVIPSGPVAT